MSQSLVAGEDIGDLLADRHDGVEGVHGGLGDNGDLPPAQATQLVPIQGQDVAPAHHDAAAGDARRRNQQPHDGGCDRRLAAAGGAGQPHHLAAADAEAEPIGADDAATSTGVLTGVVLHAQVLDT